MSAQDVAELKTYIDERLAVQREAIRDTIRREARGRLYYCPTPPPGLPQYVIIFQQRTPGAGNVLFCNGGRDQARNLNAFYGQTGDTVEQAEATPDNPTQYATRIALASGTDSAFTNNAAHA